MFSGFELKPPASVFQSYFYSSLKTSPSIHLLNVNIISDFLCSLGQSSVLYFCQTVFYFAHGCICACAYFITLIIICLIL